MKDDKKLYKKHIRIQMTQPSLKTAQNIYIRRCIDSLLQTISFTYLI